MPGEWAQQDLKQKSEILQALYSNVGKLRAGEKEGLIAFLVSCLKKSAKEDTTLLLNKITALFNEASTKKEPVEKFEQFFEPLKPLDAKLISFHNGDVLGINPWPNFKTSQHFPEHGQALLEEYMNDSDIAAALSFRNSAGQSIDVASSNVYPIHSVAKIFTGIMVLMMVHEKPDGENSILPAANLDLPIKAQLDPDVWKLLPKAVQGHIESNKVTLYQIMTHKSGLGDYGYDSGTGTYRDRLEKGGAPVVSEIRGFLQFAEEKTYPVGKDSKGKDLEHYSNLGFTLVGLVVENAYKIYKNAPLPPLNFFGMLKRYILDPANMTHFFESAPEDNVRINPNDKAAQNWVGGPAGGYWTTTNDLVNFGQWVHVKCQDQTFRTLVEEHGEEFYKDGKIIHPGNSTYASAFFLVDLESGNTAALCSTGSSGVSLGLELTLGTRIFTEEKIVIEERMKKGGIPSVSIAYVEPNKLISSLVLGVTDVRSNNPGVQVTPETIFGAASLSKPVFSYLVLKLIADKKLSTPDGQLFDLDTPISEFLPMEDFYRDFLDKKISKHFSKVANTITTRMVLSHTTGIPIDSSPRLDFLPGTEYSYGNTGLVYLQKALELHTGKSLETLAIEEVFKPLIMTNSSFLPPKSTSEDKIAEPPKGKLVPPIAANSLHTTSSDYARFASAWMQEKDCSLIKMTVEPTPENQKSAASSGYILTETNFFYYNKSKGTVARVVLDNVGVQLAALQQVTENRSIDRLSDKQLKQITTITGHTNPLREAFSPAISLMKDRWAIDMDVSEQDRQHLAWGLGLGLQLDDKGDVTAAFHSGDMNQWRGWVAMDVNTKSAVIFFANGNETKNGTGHGYGHVLAEVIIPPQVKLNHALDWFFQKFGISRNVEPGWKEKEENDTRVGDYVKSRLSAPEKIQQYRDNLREMRESEPGYMAPTESSKAKERKKFSPSPFQTTPKLPWKS